MGSVNMMTVMSTGANGSLGLACAREIARHRDWRMELACHDSRRSDQAVAEIDMHEPSASLETKELDLASLASVRRFAGSFAEPIDALVLNAGIQVVTERTETEDGIETTFAVNHLGPFLLANLVLPNVVNGGRIVF